MTIKEANTKQAVILTKAFTKRIKETGDYDLLYTCQDTLETMMYDGLISGQTAHTLINSLYALRK